MGLFKPTKESQIKGEKFEQYYIPIHSDKYFMQERKTCFIIKDFNEFFDQYLELFQSNFLLLKDLLYKEGYNSYYYTGQDDWRVMDMKAMCSYIVSIEFMTGRKIVSD